MDPNPSETLPWSRSLKSTQPFKLSKLITSNSRAYHCLACFPWTTWSLAALWGGHALSFPELKARWDETAGRWSGAVAVGGTGCIHVFEKMAAVQPLEVTLPESDAEVQNITWAISSVEPVKPLLVFTITSVILILDVTSCAIIGRLRGHGGPITSLSVHPTLPHLLCTTSRDFTARIYDLSLDPVQKPNNPHWLPNREPSLAGPAHGLHMCEHEGEGIGRCVTVMVGGRSGGHRGAALCSAFHPSQPLIATGGMDRAVKIWRIPPSVFSPPDQPVLAREDKPLFSTDLVHKARVLNVEWLADDILTSCSAPAVMRRDHEDRDDTYYEEGTVAVWQWLGFNRFFPLGKIPQKVMRGTASDWRNSESFKILSAYHLPLTTKHIHIYRSLEHDPMLLIPIGKVIRIFNIVQFKPRTPPKLPLDDLASLTERMRLDDDGHAPRGSNATAQNQEEAAGGGAVDNNASADDDLGRSSKYPPPAPLGMLFESVEGWEVRAELQRRDMPPEIPDITACVLGDEGRSIVGIGQNGVLYIWRQKETSA
ncbi:WD40 repeat-like protein [Earliella scabrosa]|nr:WD40 repeat-like protein [Earliella scabrosa]